MSHVSSPTPAILLGCDVLLEHGSLSSLHSTVSDKTDSLIVDSDAIGTEVSRVVRSSEHEMKLLAARMSVQRYIGKSPSRTSYGLKAFRSSAIRQFSTGIRERCASARNHPTYASR